MHKERIENNPPASCVHFLEKLENALIQTANQTETASTYQIGYEKYFQANHGQ